MLINKTKRKRMLFIILSLAIIASIISAYFYFWKSKSEITTNIATQALNDNEALASVSLNTNGYNRNLNGWLGNFVIGNTYYDGYCMHLGNGIPKSVTNRGSAYSWFQASRYNNLKWLFDNMIVVFQQINDNVYGSDLNNEITMYKKNMNLLISQYGYSGNVDSLTEKQIFEVQQCVMWRYLNGRDYTSKLSGNQKAMYQALIKGMNENTGYTSDGKSIATVSKGNGFGLTDDGKIGPFNLNNSKGQINKINVENFSGIDGGYTIVDKDGKKIEEYNKYNGTFYIKLNSALSKGKKYNIKGNITVKSYKTGVIEWWDGNNGNQPVTTFSREPERSSVDFDSNYFSGYLDLALKKQITQINGVNVDSNVRSLDINANGLLNNTSVDATYNMRKTPVSVDIGDSVKYEIKIFNESKDLDGYAKEITDYLPDGLKFNISSDVNAKNNWRLYTSDGSEAKWNDEDSKELIAKLYKQVLNRTETEEQLKKNPDVLTYWNSFRAGRITIEKTISDIINSTEGKNNTSKLTNKKYITLLYNVILGREPDVNGLTSNMKYLAENPNGREQLVANFLNSTEFRKLKYSKIPDTELDNVKYITTERLANNKIAKLTNQASLTANSKSVEVELIVKNGASGVLTNIAEITKYGYMDGSNFIEANKAKVDRDSIQGNVTVPSEKTSLENYWGKDGKQKSEPANYPGQQDDDDFEKVKVNKIVDLALKKSIISIGDTNYKRLGEIDVTPLKQGETTANYHINKYVLYATQGDIVTYRIYIFNEGSVDATASEIKDYLPEELEFLPDDELNKSYGWTAETNNETKITTLTTTYLKNRFIDKYTKQMQEYDVDPNCAFVDVRCKVKDDAKPDKRLVNIAEINEYQTSGATLTKDVDSGTKQNGSVKLPTIAAWEKYVTKYNINDMDKNGYYVFYGQEDDDDYDSLTVRKNKRFDLALRKFITGVNDEGITNRVPNVDEESYAELLLKNTALYKHTKEAVEVNNGDVITYTIRVYNEGEKAGKATEITDYLPEGLEFYSSEVDGINYGWSVVEGTNGKEIKTSYLADKNFIVAAESYDVFKNDGYADVKVKCKVNLQNTNQTVYLTNRAEITAHIDEDGNVQREGLDRDSTPKNVKDKHIADMLNYDSNITYDSNKHYPGYEDDDDKETVFVKQTTNFSINLLKVSKKQLDDNTPTALNGAKFTLAEVNPDNMDEVINNLAPITTGNSQMQIISRDNCKIGSTYLYKLQETEAPDGFNILIDIPIYIQVTINEDGSFDTARTRILYNAENGSDVSEFYRFAIEGNNINIRIANEEKGFDLALRKYITGIERDGITSEVKNRIPDLNVFSLVMWKRNGTAGYYHTKEAVAVKKDDIITYTISVYNEGFVKGYATEITDYLPSGLEYINNDFNRNNGWSGTKNSDGTTTVKTTKLANTLLNENQLQNYLLNSPTTTWKTSVKIQCKVTSDPKYEVQYLTNRAEITQDKAVSIDDNGNETVLNVTDRDSKPNNVKAEHSADMLDYDSNITYDSNEYYPGYQDDDDKETVKIEPITDIEFRLKKVDNITREELEGAVFNIEPVSDSKITSIVDSNGNEISKDSDGNITIPIGGAIIKATGVDVGRGYAYNIREMKAPDKHKKVVDNMVIVVNVDKEGKSSAEIGAMSVYEISNKNGHEVEELKRYDNVGEGTEDKVTVKKENNEIVVTVANKNTDTFDLALRKFITNVNDTELTKENSRVPTFNITSQVALNSKGTANYYHKKDAVTVKNGDIVTYTIRVYNESDIKGKVAEITDYLPKGLEFYSSEVDGVNYDWKVTKNNDGTTTLKTNYLENTELEKNQLMEQLVGLQTTGWFADVKLKCKVTEDSGYTIKYLTNRAEITAHEDERGNKYGEYYGETKNTDRDSLPDTIKNTLNLDNYYKENVLDKENLSYYPGAQDDDDFETLQIEPVTDINFNIEKRNFLNNLKLTDKITFKIEEINPDIDIWNGINDKDILNSKTVDIVGEGNIDTKTKVAYNTTYRYRITEEKVPETYSKSVREVIVKIKVDSNGVAQATIEKWNDSTWNSVIGKKYTYITDKGNNNILLTVKNEPIAKYNLKLIKVNEATGKQITDKTDFSVLDKDQISHRVSTGLGYTGMIANDIKITTDEGEDTYVISEITPPEGYIKITDFDLIIRLKKGISSDRSNYAITKYEKILSQKSASASTEKQREILEKATIEPDKNDANTIIVSFPNEKLEGKYYLNLNKVDTDGNTINDKEATFIVNGDEKVTKKGFLSIDEGKGFDITSENQNDKYVINESLAPEGYFKFEGKITLDVKVKEQDGAYKLDSNKTTLIVEENGTTYQVSKNDNSKQVMFTINEDTGHINIKVKNPKLTGKYKIQVKKRDANNPSKAIQGVVFNGLNPKQISTGDKVTAGDEGIAVLWDEVEISKPNSNGDIYTIKEKSVPEGYTKIEDHQLIVRVKTGVSDDGKSYVVKDATVSINQMKSSENTKQESEMLEKGLDINVDDKTQTITVTVPNQKTTKYNLEINKVDAEVSSEYLNKARFTINGPNGNIQTDKALQRTTDDEPTGRFVKEESGVRVNKTYTYTIEETYAQELYENVFKNFRIKLEVAIDKNGKVDKENTVVKVEPKALNNTSGLAKASDMVKDGLSINEETNTVTLNIKNPQTTRDYSLSLFKHELGDKNKEISGVKFNIERKQRDDDEWTVINDSLITDSSKEEKIDSQEKVKLGTTYYYQVEEKEKPNKNYVNKIKKAVLKIVVDEDGTVKGEIISVVEEGKTETTKYDANTYGKYIELVKDSGDENKFVLKIANSISYHMTLRKRADNKSTTDITGCKILEGGEFKIDKISRNSRGQISTTEIYKGSATWDFADIEAVPNSVYEYYIQEINAPEGFNNDFENIKVHLTIRIDANGNVADVGRNGTNVDFESVDGTQLQDKIKTLLYSKCVLEVEDNTITINMKDSEIVKEPEKYGFQIVKVDKDNVEKKLEGVEFRVRMRAGNAADWIAYDTNSDEPGTQNPVTNSNGVINIQDIELVTGGKDIFQLDEVKGKDGYKLLSGVTVQVTIDLNGVTNVKQITEDHIKVELIGENAASYPEGYMTTNITNDGMIQIIVPNQETNFEFVLNKKDEKGNLITADRSENGKLDGAAIRVREQGSDNIIVPDVILEDGTTSRTISCMQNKTYTYLIDETQNKTGYKNCISGYFVVLQVVTDEKGEVKDTNPDDPNDTNYTRVSIIKVNPHTPVTEEEAKSCVSVSVGWVNGKRQVTLDIKNPFVYNLKLKKVDSNKKELDKAVLKATIKGGNTYTMNKVSNMEIPQIEIADNETQTWYIREENVEAPYYNILGSNKYIQIDVTRVSGTLKVNDYAVYDNESGIVSKNDEIYKYIKVEEPVVVGSEYIINVTIENPVQYKYKLTKTKTDPDKTELTGATVKVNEKTVIDGGNSSCEVSEIVKLGEERHYIISETSTTANHVNILENKFAVVLVRMSEQGEISVVQKLIYDITSVGAVLLPQTDEVYDYLTIDITRGSDGIQVVDIKLENPAKYKFELTKVKSDEEKTELSGAVLTVNGKEAISDGKSKYNITEKINIGQTKSYIIKESSTITNHINVLKDKFIVLVVRLDEQEKLSIVSQSAFDISSGTAVTASPDVWNYVDVYFEEENGVQILKVDVVNPVEYKFKVMKTKSDKASTPLSGATITINGEPLIKDGLSSYEITKSIKIGEKQTFYVRENATKPGYKNILENKYLLFNIVLTEDEKIEIESKAIFDTSGKVPTVVSSDDPVYNYVDVYMSADSNGVQTVNIKIINPLETKFRLVKVTSDGETNLAGAKITVNGTEVIKDGDSSYETTETMKIGDTRVYNIDELETVAGHINILENKQLVVITRMYEDEKLHVVDTMIIDKKTRKTLEDSRPEYKYITTNITTENEVQTVQVNIINPEEYNFKLYKVDKDTNEKMNEVFFDIKVVDEQNNEVELKDSKTFEPKSLKTLKTTNISGVDGVISIDNILIEKPGTYDFIIKEYSPELYVENGEIRVRVFITNENGSYKVSNMRIIEGEDSVEFANSKVIEDEPETVEVQVNNERIKGKYDLVINKLDNYTKKLLDGSKFNITVERDGKESELYKSNDDVKSKDVIIPSEVEVKNGNLIISDIRIEKPETYIIKIKETKAPETYLELEEEIKLKVTTGIEGEGKEEKYVIKDVEMISGDNNGLVTKSNVENKIQLDVQNEQFDLSLRKSITEVIANEGKEDERVTKIDNRIPDPQTDGLKNKTATTAVYNHTKQPIRVYAGNTVIYTLRVYNEGQVDGYAEEVTDHLPEYLEFVNDEFNSSYGWLLDEKDKSLRTIKTNYLSKAVNAEDNLIKAFDRESGKLDYKEIKIKCKVKSNVPVKEKLTNIAEITKYIGKNGRQVKDRDSFKNVELPTDDKLSSYKDDEINKSYVPGQEDDDDFEKVLVEEFDLALRKYITKVDNKEITDRVPVFKIDENGNYVYNHTKEPVLVGDSDVVTYNIRVYNEGTVAGYAEEVEDDIPEGLVFLPDNETNQKFGWKMLDANKQETNDPKEAKYIRTKYLSSANKDNLLKAFDKNSMSEPDSKFVQVAFKVDVPDATDEIIINKAQITDDKDEDGKDVTDKDSTPNKWIDGEDDQDIEKIKLTYFDLALRKFITKVNDTEVTDRVPVFKVDENGKYVYEHTKEPVIVNNTNVVTYTLRVYNEGTREGYAKEIKDDIPQGLEFLPDNELNKEYRWIMLDEEGNKTDDVTKAKYITSDYLSKEQEKSEGENLLKAFDKEAYNAGKITEPDYKEVQVSFKVTEPNTSDRIIINKAQISDDSDEDGNEVTDKDSTPNEWIEGEDDQDIEKIKVQYFDLALRKWVTKAIVTENGKETVTETGHKAEDDPEEVVKVDLKKSKIKDVVVKFEYQIRVTNEGQIAGSVEEISDYIPEGLKFVAADNPLWKEVDGKVVTDQLAGQIMQPGESKEVTILLTWINREDNMGLKINVAEISKDYNEYGSPDIDSTPNNKVPGEDDIDDAPVMLTVTTGQEAIYVGLSIAVLIVIAIGSYEIKRFVVKKDKK